MTRLSRRLLLPPARAYERVLGGGRLRERLLTAALRRHYRSEVRLAWSLRRHGDELPHSTNFRAIATEFAFGTASVGHFYRAFFTADVIRDGDRLLDIGCGDGFADRRFYSERCSRIDAIDTDPTAIARARRHNSAANVVYGVVDAVSDPFPSPPYDVIVWDGAIGHFPPETISSMLEKIRASLSPRGVFTGSESLGRREGHDHLMFFDRLDDLADLLRRFFPEVRVRRLQYRLSDDFERVEAYWRCSIDPERLQTWQ